MPLYIDKNKKDKKWYKQAKYQLVKQKGTDKKFQAKFYSTWDDVDDKKLNREMAAREIDFSTTMHHPNIEAVSEVITSKKFSSVADSMIKSNADPPILITEFNEGGDLRTLIDWMQANNQTFAESTLLEMMYQTLSALQYAHSLGIVHREIMPSNLHLTNDF